MDLKLQGRVTSIGAIRTTSPVGMMGMDSLVLSFADAKVHVIHSG